MTKDEEYRSLVAEDERLADARYAASERAEREDAERRATYARVLAFGPTGRPARDS